MTRFASKKVLVTILLFLVCSFARPQTPTNTTVYIYDELGRLKAVITPSGEASPPLAGKCRHKSAMSALLPPVRSGTASTARWP